MTFSSLTYFLYLPLVYLVFCLAADRFRWLVLLLAGYVFYGWFLAPHLTAALLAVTWVSYRCGVKLDATTDEGSRRKIFWLGTSVSLAILAAVKYLLPWSGSHPSFLISIGVSYFTFQAISYLADVYLELIPAEAHVGHHALALSFFPKLLQGPIERAGNLLPQLKRSFRFDPRDLQEGLLLFGWGLFQKVVVADRLALFADHLFGDLRSYTGISLLVGSYAYAFQIFFDFSGYTDMARGSARIFGVSLSRNFNSPYLATSVADFWRRWHISFSSWILDYIFRPLQIAWRGHGQLGVAAALIVTFLASGLWHGATWGFLAWGLCHGLFMAVSTFYRPYGKKLHQALGVAKSRWLKVWQVIFTFHLVAVAWVFFRTSSLADAWYLFSHLFVSAPKAGEPLSRYLLLGQSWREAVAALLLLGSLAVGSLLMHRLQITDLIGFIQSRSTACRWAVYYLLILTTAVCAVYGNTGFIYYKF